MNETLDPIQRLALSKIEYDDAREQVAPGVYEVDFTVRVHGCLRVAVDHPATPTNKVPLIAGTALALKKMGVQRENFLNLFRESLIEAWDVSQDVREALIKEVGLKEYEEDFRKKVLAKLPKVPVKGAVVASLLVDLLDD